MCTLETSFLNYICKMANLKRGIILMNLGSPDSTEVDELRKYLNEFLTDKRVIDSWSVRNILIRNVIVPRRAPKSAEAYRTIWTKDGSPLIQFTRELAEKLQNGCSGTGKYCHALWKSLHGIAYESAEQKSRIWKKYWPFRYTRIMRCHPMKRPLNMRRKFTGKRNMDSN